MNLRSRLARLEGGASPGDCPRPATGVLLDVGQVVPDDVEPCRRCGGVHAVHIEEVIVTVAEVQP